MPSTVAALGVAAYSNTTTQSVEITKTVEETHLVEKDGTYGPGRKSEAGQVWYWLVESVTQAADPDALARSLAGAEPLADADSGDARALPAADERRSDLWPLVLAALLFVLVFETWLGFRRSRDAAA
jgi:hypothetical protein